MSHHTPSLAALAPAPHASERRDGWTPARQRIFLETLAAAGMVGDACEEAGLSRRSAYNLRFHREGAAFRLGWDAAILIARARLADDLLARALEGQEDVITRDEFSGEVVRRRHDNRLAMSMLARLDRMADSPAEGTDAALARIVSQDFAAYLDLVCPEGADEESGAGEADGGPASAAVPVSVSALSPGASAALFIALRVGPAGAENRALEPCELRGEESDDAPAEAYDPHDFLARNNALLRAETPEEAAACLRGVWKSEETDEWLTDFPPPPGFSGDGATESYVMGEYERGLTPEEEAAHIASIDAEWAPLVAAAEVARDEYFGFAPRAA